MQRLQLNSEKTVEANHSFWTRTPENGWSEPTSSSDLGQIHYELSANNLISSITINHEHNDVYKNTFNIIFHGIKNLPLLLNATSNFKYIVDNMLHDERDYSIYIHQNYIIQLLGVLADNDILGLSLVKNIQQEVRNKISCATASHITPHTHTVLDNTTIIKDEKIPSDLFASGQRVQISNASVEGSITAIASSRMFGTINLNGTKESARIPFNSYVPGKKDRRI